MKSEKGVIGLVLADTRPGDEIALFKGSGSPLIIRKCGGEAWMVLGDSYVHSIIDAKFFDEDKCDTIWIA